MPEMRVLSYRNQIDHFPIGDGGTLTIVPGPNLVDGQEMKAAMSTTDGNDTGFRARVSSGDYEVRVPQVAVGKRGN